jgi:mannose-6-phosphate isomerase
MIRISPLKNPIREYAWGSRSAIQDLLDLPEDARSRPMAELWMGAHPTAPSRVWDGHTWVRLDRAIEQDAEGLLGRETAETFDRVLPFLFKVLAAEQPLSIQIHPGAESAKAGFQRENREGVPLDDPRRTYKDPFHKPELLCALDRFCVLQGFRPVEETLRMLVRVAGSSLFKEIQELKEQPNAEGLRRLFSTLMGLDPQRREVVTGEAVRCAIQHAGEDEVFSWMARLGETYPGDIGILSPVLMNLVTLSPGEAIYVGAGEVHAYLQGVALEIMANSDNVIRGGLTPKHVNQAELLRNVRFQPGPVDLLRPEEQSSGGRVYACPAREFLLTRIPVSMKRDRVHQGSGSVEILFCLKGACGVTDLETGREIVVSRGNALLVSAAVEAYRMQGEATLYRASVPAPVL